MPPRIPLSPRSAGMPPSGKVRKTVPPEPPEPSAEPDAPPEPEGGGNKPTRPHATARIAEARKTRANVFLPMSLLTYAAERRENTQDFREDVAERGRFELPIQV
jgi:hypothetical protein